MKLDELSLAKFMALLDEEYQWPAEYLFKFIVPAAQREHFQSELSLTTYSEKPSKTGKYTAFTYKLKMHSAAEVVAVYQKAAKISGVLSL